MEMSSVTATRCAYWRAGRAPTPRSRTDPEIEWVAGDLSTGDGIHDAVASVDAIVHAATNSPAARRGHFQLRDFVVSPADVDVHKTRALLAAAAVPCR
jgi:hypothetical protein